MLYKNPKFKESDVESKEIKTRSRMQLEILQRMRGKPPVVLEPGTAMEDEEMGDAELEKLLSKPFL